LKVPRSGTFKKISVLLKASTGCIYDGAIKPKKLWRTLRVRHSFLGFIMATYLHIIVIDVLGNTHGHPELNVCKMEKASTGGGDCSRCADYTNF
jgi:hypothetical protein